MKNIIGITLVPLLLGAASVHADPGCADAGQPFARESKAVLAIVSSTDANDIVACGSEPAGDEVTNVFIGVKTGNLVENYRILRNNGGKILKLEYVDQIGLPK